MLRGALRTSVYVYVDLYLCESGQDKNEVRGGQCEKVSALSISIYVR